MKNSQKVIETLVKLSMNDKLPYDMNELSPEHFSFLDTEEPICGWKRVDVTDMATQMGITLDDDQVNDVMAKMEHYFDASIGMTWDHIEDYINQVTS